MSFGGSNLPRDANVSTSLATSPYDVSRGNFSGGLLNVRSRGGQQLHHPLDEPQRRRAANAVDRRGRPFPRPAVSQPFRRRTLLGADPDRQVVLLGRVSGGPAIAGSSQSAQHRCARASDRRARRAIPSRDLLSILDRSHVPATVAGIPGARLNDQASSVRHPRLHPALVDDRPGVQPDFQRLVERGRIRRASRPPSCPAHSGERSNYYGGVQAQALELLRLRRPDGDVGRREPDAFLRLAVRRSAQRVGARELDLRRRHCRACRPSRSAAIRR